VRHSGLPQSFFSPECVISALGGLMDTPRDQELLVSQRGWVLFVEDIEAICVLLYLLYF